MVCPNDKGIKSWIGRNVNVIIDRSLGTGHSDYPENIYPVNYGYIPGTLSEADNEEIDAYIFGSQVPLKKFTRKVIGVIARKDSEIKLIVTDGRLFTKDEILDKVDFQEKYHKSTLFM